MPKINSLSPITAGVLTLCFSFSADAQSAERPFPILPATLEEAVYQGQKGCIADNERTEVILTGISANEGTMIVGAQKYIETTNDGAHFFQMIYSKNKDYAYILADKAQGKLCVTDKLTEVSFKKAGKFSSLNITTSAKYTSTQCDFVQRYGQICGTFNQVSTSLIKNGFAINWQGKNADGDIQTLLSGKGKSYLLTTDDKSGATVVTGVGDYEFKFIDELKNQ